jgi:Lon protease-like protein
MLRHPKSLGLFPLHSVLLPGAMLSLRVFERRYLDLVRECSQDSRGFGVCLILIGDETGVPATPAKYGTQARIEDFTTGTDGLLHLRIRGGRRFHVDTTHVRDNGLLLADVHWCEHDPDDELRPEHATLGIVLQHIAEQSAARSRRHRRRASTKPRGSAGAWPNCCRCRIATPVPAADRRSARTPGQVAALDRLTRRDQRSRTRNTGCADAGCGLSVAPCHAKRSRSRACAVPSFATGRQMPNTFTGRE